MKFSKILTLIFLLVITQVTMADSLSASVDRSHIGEDETLTLSITYDDANISGQPHLGGLENSFEILNSSSSSETRIINGSISSTKKWRYSLMPKKTGKLLIPSFSIKDSYSEPIEIDVVDNATIRSTQSGNRGDLFIESTVNKREAYAQEMITLTLRIYTSVQIAQPKLPELTLPGFMIEKIGESQFETRESDRNYYVLEYRYALFANQSGDFNIPKQRYQIAQIISNGPRSLFNIPGFDTQTQARFLSTDEIPLRILPIPANNPVDYWLASDDVTLTDNWETEKIIELGTPITRTIEIKALGNLAANIPPLPDAIPANLKSYREQPTLSDARAGENLLATRTESMAIVAIEPGTYTLPEIRLHWWSNKEKQFKTSSLPERHITVLSAASSTETSLSPPNTIPETELDQDANKDPIISFATAPFYLNVYLWMGISAGLLIILLLTLFVLLIRKKHSPTKLTSVVSIEEQSARDNMKELKIACHANDPKRARNAMINWGKKQWANDNVLTIYDIKQKINHSIFNSLASELDSVLYQKTARWNGKPLLDFLNSDGFLSKLSDRPSSQKEITLPSLYD